jgi:sensor histidine kinase regulating citrate/malate metabolism
MYVNKKIKEKFLKPDEKDYTETFNQIMELSKKLDVASLLFTMNEMAREKNIDLIFKELEK